MVSEIIAESAGNEVVVRDESESEEAQQNQHKTPLPMLQLVVVFCIQFTEPIAALVIYPFVNQYVRESGITGGDEKKTGYYAGLIESIFFVAEAATVYYWGVASDRFGRRPILLLGPLGLAGALLSFGLAGSFPVMVVSRAFQGMFNGNIGVAKSVIAEMTDSTNMADAYAFIPLIWTTGSTLAPIIGGVLARPAEQWPGIFAKYRLFTDHPYFLPCAAAAGIALLAFTIATIGLRETLPSAKAKTADQYRGEDSRLLDDASSMYGSLQTERGSVLPPPQADPPATFRDLMIPQVLQPLVVYGIFNFIEMCMMVIQPLIYSTSVKYGGLGLAPSQIGIIMSVWGFLNASLQATFLGPLIRRIGPKNVLVCTFTGYLISLGLYPLLRYLAMKNGEVSALVKVVMAIQLTCAFTVSSSYGAMQVIIVDSAPTKSTIGATNGMAQAVSATMRAAAPSIASSLFSVSLERNLLGGNFVFLLLLVITLAGMHRTLRLHI